MKLLRRLRPYPSNSDSGRQAPESRPPAAFLGETFEEKPLWAELGKSLGDFFFPAKLPPLELESTPVPVPDRMAAKKNPWAYGISAALNLSLLLLVLLFAGKKIIETVQPKFPAATDFQITDFMMHGGGGGGDRSPIDASKGKLPELKKNPITPPQIPVLEQPKLAVPSAIDVDKQIQLPDQDLPVVGLTGSASVVLSNGPGGGAGVGTGSHDGLGPGDGPGYGPGRNGNIGSLYHVGGNISAPVALFQPDAEFSDEARRAKYQGICLVWLIVDAHGDPQNVHILRALGMGLDEKALEAVRRYKFKPALKDGKTPVPVTVQVEVNFRLY